MSGQLLHVVFFKLQDNSEAKQQALVTACEKYLKPQAGIVHFACGMRDVELLRDVNDTDFDVSLAIQFESREAQDRYQQDATHHQFIAEQKDNWSQVRVFDSHV